MDWEEGWGKGEKQEGRLKWCRLCGDANLYELDMLLIGNQQRGTKREMRRWYWECNGCKSKICAGCKTSGRLQPIPLRAPLFGGPQIAAI
jgi:hypothetical protein